MDKPTRKQAVTTHLCLSILVVGAIVAIIMVYWYPWDLMALQGAFEILVLIIFIDVILGPSLTLLVYRPNKRFLTLDLTTIAILQIAALVYGTYTIYQGKVSYLAFLQDKFYLVKQMDLIGQAPFDLGKTQRISPYGPHIVDVKAQTGANQDFTTLISALMNDQSPTYIASNYREFPIDHHGLSSTTLKLPELPSNIGKRIQKAAEKLKTDPKDLFYYPVRGKVMNGIAILNPKTSELVDIIAHEPVEQPEETTK